MPSQTKRERLADLFKAGEYESVEIEARRLIDRRPNSGFAWKALGSALHKQKKMSLDVLHRAAELLPDDAEAQSNLGNALRENGKVAEAVVCYRRALELEPDNDAAYCNLGAAQKQMGLHTEALASFRRAIARDGEKRDAGK